MTSSQWCSKYCPSLHRHTQSLSSLIDGHFNNVLRQTARHQQGTASADWYNKTYSCSFPKGYVH